MKKIAYIIVPLLILVFTLVFYFLMKSKEESKLSLKINTEKKTEKILKEKEHFTFQPIQKDEVFNIIYNNKSTEIKKLKEKFEEAEYEIHKALYASILMRLGVNDEKYFNYLKEKADLILNDDRPYPLARDKEGKDIRGKLAPKFENWCKKNEIELRECLAQWLYTNPAIINYLGLTGDERFFPYLEAGINSSNRTIVKASANGLGILGDKRGIPLIEEALKNTKDVRDQNRIARSLFFFNDPYAEELAQKYITNPYDIRDFKEAASQGDYGLLLKIY